MPQYVIEATTRFLVNHADAPERAIAWFNDADDIDVDVSPISYGHLQVVGAVADGVAPVQLLEPGSYEAWHAANVYPLSAAWHADPWPARACTSTDADPPSPLEVHRPVLLPPAGQETLDGPGGRGGYRPIARLTGWLYDIKLEALTARQSKTRDRRDRAFIEIAELAQRCVDFSEKHARPLVAERPREASHAAD